MYLRTEYNHEDGDGGGGGDKEQACTRRAGGNADSVQGQPLMLDIRNQPALHLTNFTSRSEAKF